MKIDEIIKGDKLIAKFMNFRVELAEADEMDELIYKILSDTHLFSKGYRTNVHSLSGKCIPLDIPDNKVEFFLGLFKDEFKYHSSWDWLMPVVHKIQEVAGDDESLFESDHFISVINTIPYANIKDSFKVII